MPENHSQHEANKMLRVLNGGNGKMKYTVRVHHPDGKMTEFTSLNVSCGQEPLFWPVASRTRKLLRGLSPPVAPLAIISRVICAEYRRRVYDSFTYQQGVGG